MELHIHVYTLKMHSWVRYSEGYLLNENKYKRYALANESCPYVVFNSRRPKLRGKWKTKLKFNY